MLAGSMRTNDFADFNLPLRLPPCTADPAVQGWTADQAQLCLLVQRTWLCHLVQRPPRCLPSHPDGADPTGHMRRYAPPASLAPWKGWGGMDLCRPAFDPPLRPLLQVMDGSQRNGSGSKAGLHPKTISPLLQVMDGSRPPLRPPSAARKNLQPLDFKPPPQPQGRGICRGGSGSFWTPPADPRPPVQTRGRLPSRGGSEGGRPSRARVAQ